MKILLLAAILTTCGAMGQRVEKSTPVPCNKKASLMLYDAEYFKEITKGLNDRVKANGGYGFSLVMYASPFPEPDFNISENEVYKWSIVEKYPDRNVSTVHLVYDPVTSQAYQQYMDDDAHRHYFTVKVTAMEKCKK